jgi:hypothetical protein
VTDAFTGLSWQRKAGQSMESAAAARGPTIDPVFERSEWQFYVSSTPVADRPMVAWGVDFGEGTLSTSNGGTVRCVR